MLELSTVEQIKQNKNRIFCAFANKGEAEKIRSEYPYWEFANLTMFFSFLISKRLSGLNTVYITNDILEKLEMTIEELYVLALINTQRLFPYRFMTIEEMLFGVKFNEEDSSFMYVLTNDISFLGSLTIAYPNLLEDIANKLNSNIYILPSSVHEVIILPDIEGACSNHLNDMVSFVNSTEVDPEDILSDSVLYYDRKSQKLITTGFTNLQDM